MKIVIACDSYKGSCSAQRIVDRVAEGIHRVYPDAETIQIPIADGGEGTIDAFLYSVGGEKHKVTVMGPIGEPVEAEYGLLKNGIAVIEMAAASGLPLVPKEKRDPARATSYGTGQLIRAALNAGCKEIIIGIGGSATNDAGAGMMQALGVRFLDKSGNELEKGGLALRNLHTIDVSGLDGRLANTKITVACDVTNPLCGPNGASAIYGSQKGADPAMIELLDQSLLHFGQIACQQLGINVLNVPGAGAAGGMGASILLFCGGVLHSGIDILLDSVGFNKYVRDADFVITGEGRIDGQSVNGKVPIGVARRTKKVHPIPVYALVGSIGRDVDKVYSEGIDGIMSIVPGPMSLNESMEQAEELICAASERLIRIIKCVSK